MYHLRHQSLQRLDSGQPKLQHAIARFTDMCILCTFLFICKLIEIRYSKWNSHHAYEVGGYDLELWQ